MIFQAHKSNTFLSYLIRLLSLGSYSHISIRLGIYVYEADIQRGVIRTLYSKWDSSTVVETKEVHLTNKQYTTAYDWLNEQLGKKYDFTGVISFLFALLPPRKGYWYCSELAIVALAKVRGISNRLESQKISPTLFWDILELMV